MAASKIILYDDEILRLDEIRKFIDVNFSQQLNIEILAEKFSLSPTTLRRQFLQYYNEPIGYYIRRCRMISAMSLLKGHSHAIPISQLGMTVGYNHRSAFTHAFSKFFGKPPAYFLRNSGQDPEMDRSSTH